MHRQGAAVATPGRTGSRNILHGAPPGAPRRDMPGDAERIVNLFGRAPAPADDTTQAFLGAFPTARARYQALAELAARLLREDVGRHATGDVPAGYTYFGQFVAHDLAFALDEAPEIGADSARARTTLRRRRLQLETIYGDGPVLFPAGYAVDRDGGGGLRRDRVLLRTGRVIRHNRPGEMLAPGSAIADADLPRAACPFLNDTRSGLHGAATPAASRLVSALAEAIAAGSSAEAIYRDLIVPHTGAALHQTDALVADVRNDSHTLIAQMTTLFHRLHNRLVTALEARGSLPNAAVHKRDLSLFARARALAVDTYRRVIVADFLPRILDAAVLARYLPRTAAGRIDAAARVDFLTRRPAAAVPIEFTFGAYRFGHAMVRDIYRFDFSSFSIDDVLLRSGEVAPELFPLTSDWRVDWSNFFQLDATKAPQMSIRLAPRVPALSDPRGNPVPEEAEGIRVRCSDGDELEVEGLGLPFRDLIRQVTTAQTSIAAIVARMRADPRLRAIVDGQPILVDAAARRNHVAEWLAAGRVIFAPGVAEHFADHPPLSLFVLLEAEALGGGRRLGPLGSFVVCETVLGALAGFADPYDAAAPVPHAANYADAFLAPDDTDLVAVFGSDPPGTMPELIRFLDAS